MMLLLRCSFLKEVSQKEPQVFICHFYNTYFAHTAGGRMIGSKVSQMILDNKQLNFYKYDSDVKELLNKVRDDINEVRAAILQPRVDVNDPPTCKAFTLSLREGLQYLTVLMCTDCSRMDKRAEGQVFGRDGEGLLGRIAVACVQLLSCMLLTVLAC